MITGNVIGGSPRMPETLILCDESGNEYTAVMTDEEVTLTATPNDLRIGTTAALANGIKTGTKEIPAYNTTEGVVLIRNGDPYVIPNLKRLDLYDFTKMQSVICNFNTDISDSTSTAKVLIDEKLYDVLSSNPTSSVLRNSEDKTVEFGSVNNTGKLQILRFITYKEIY